MANYVCMYVIMKYYWGSYRHFFIFRILLVIWYVHISWTYHNVFTWTVTSRRVVLANYICMYVRWVVSETLTADSLARPSVLKPLEWLTWYFLLFLHFSLCLPIVFLLTVEQCVCVGVFVYNELNFSFKNSFVFLYIV